MTYPYDGKEYDSLFELAKVMYRDGEFFSRELRKETLLAFIEEKDPRKADKIKRLSPLSYPDDVFVFLAAFVLNPHMSFRIGGYLFKTYQEIGEKMLSYSPNINNVLLQIVSYQLISKHMHCTQFDLDNRHFFEVVVKIERQADKDREKAYFSLGYLLSGKKTIIYKGVEYKDVYNLTYYLAKKEKDLRSLGAYLSSSPLIEAYRDFSNEGEEIEAYLHVIKSYERDRQNLNAFLERKRQREKARHG